MSNINTTVPDNRDLSNFPGEYGLPFLGKTIEVVKDSIAVCNDHFKRFGAVSKIDMVRGQRVWVLNLMRLLYLIKTGAFLLLAVMHPHLDRFTQMACY